MRNGLLRQLLDAGTPGPTDGLITDNPSWRRQTDHRDKAKVSDKQKFNIGDGVSSKDRNHTKKTQ